MERTILVTGSEGLIARHTIPLLERDGFQIKRLDINDKADPRDLCDEHYVKEVVAAVDGVLHLGGVSRVVWGQQAPETCVKTNTQATAALINACLARHNVKPWFVYASSREVYGQASAFPVHEDYALEPLNVYARSKKDSEAHCLNARKSGLICNIVRFSSVYGCPFDHPDRVAPAFARAAAFGGVINIEGSDNELDFTFIDDVAEGLRREVALTDRGELLPPIHFVSGRGTTLGQLANLAKNMSQANVIIQETAPRNYDVSRFVGAPERALQLLGWRANTSIEEGLRITIDRLRSAFPTESSVYAVKDPA